MRARALWAVGVAALGVAAAWLGPAAPFALIAAAALVRMARHPLLLVHALVLFQPIEGLLTRGQPQAVRSLDEICVVLILAVVLLLDLYRDGLRRFLGHPLLLPLLLFVGLGVFSALANGTPLAISAAGVYVSIDYVLLAILVGLLSIGRAELEGIYRLLLTVALFVAAVALAYGVVASPLVNPAAAAGVPSTIPRLAGHFSHPNELANFLAVPLALAFGVICYPTVPVPRLRLLTIVLASTFILSQGRVAWLSLFAAGVVFIAVHQRDRAAGLLRPALVLLLLFSPLVYRSLAERIGYTLQRGDARISIMQRALPVLREHAWFGVGPGRFGGVVADRYGADLEVASSLAITRVSWRLATVDNFWLHLLVESGLVGTASFLLLLAVVLSLSHRLLQRAPIDDPARPLAAACFILTLYQVLFNLSAPALEDNSMSSTYWLLAGLLVAVSRRPSAPDANPDRV